MGGYNVNKKNVKKYTYLGLGFPIELHNIDMVQVNNEWHPRIDVKAVADLAIRNLITLETRLTGNQVKFIRSYFQMSLRDFGKVVNETHSAVKKWEDHMDRQTKMDVNIEIMMRLFIYNRIYKETKENKVKFYDNYIQITKALYEDTRNFIAC